MTVIMYKILDNLVIRLRVHLTESEFGTSKQYAQLEDIADEMEMLLLNNK